MSDSHTIDRNTLYNFKIDRILGKGGTGTVYRGINRETGQVVALKLFLARFFKNRLHIMDLARSVKTFKKFNHPNVVKILDFIDGREGQCLIQEYVDGPDLKWYIGNRDWSLQERLVLSAQICNGLQYIHEQGYTHHDLKPSNILFTRKGIVKICDYSLHPTGFLGIFDTGLGDQVTPMYVAPELIQKEKATPRSDIYSLGMTFYLLFTGKLAFEVDSLQKVYFCHMQIVPDHPSDVNRRCPHALGDIIMKMVEKDPAKRFRDCDQLRIALADIGRSRI